VRGTGRGKTYLREREGSGGESREGSILLAFCTMVTFSSSEELGRPGGKTKTKRDKAKQKYWSWEEPPRVTNETT